MLSGVTASRTEKNAGTYATKASGTDGNYNLTFVDGSMVIKEAVVKEQRPSLPPVLTPALVTIRQPYALTLLALPEQGDALVHLQLRDVIQGIDVELPEALSQWLRAAGGAQVIGVEGEAQDMALSADSRVLSLPALADRRLPLELVLKTPKGQAVLHITRTPWWR